MIIDVGYKEIAHAHLVLKPLLVTYVITCNLGLLELVGDS
jgi:hypothetical protein